MRFFIPFFFYIFRLCASDSCALAETNRETPEICSQTRVFEESLSLLYQTESLQHHDLHHCELQERLKLRHHYLVETYEKVDNIKYRSLWLDDNEIFYLNLSLKCLLAHYFLHCVAIKKQERCEEPKLCILFKTFYELSMSMEKRNQCLIKDWHFHLSFLEGTLQGAYLLGLLCAENHLNTVYQFPQTTSETFRILGIHFF